MLKEVSFKGYAVRLFITFFGLVFAAYGVGLTVTAQLGVKPGVRKTVKPKI